MNQLIESPASTAVAERATVGEEIGEAVVDGIWADAMLAVRQKIAVGARHRFKRITGRFKAILDDLRVQYTVEQAGLAALEVKDLRDELVECFAAAKRNLTAAERTEIADLADKLIKQTLDEIAGIEGSKPVKGKKSS